MHCIPALYNRLKEHLVPKADGICATALLPSLPYQNLQRSKIARKVVGMLGFLAFGLLSILPPLAGTALLLMTLGELAIAFSDVVIDGVVVECSRGEDQATAGSLQSICWGSQARHL